MVLMHGILKQKGIMKLQKSTALTHDAIADIIDRFVNDADIQARSRQTYKNALRQFFKWLATEKITNPTRDAILRYKEYLDIRGLRPLTRSNYLVAIRRFFTWAEGNKYYPNIAKDVKGVRRSIKVHQKHALSLEQAHAVLASIDIKSLQGKRDYALINLLIRSGLRLIEVQRANICDLEMDGDDAYLWVRGKGEAGKDAFVVLTEEALDPLLTYIRARPAIKAASPLFASVSDRNRHKRLTVYSLSRLIKRQLRSAGINNRRITAHSLRHTFGVLAIKAGASLYEVQLAMRHAMPNTTQIYLGDIEQQKRREGGAERRIQNLFKAKS